MIKRLIFDLDNTLIIWKDSYLEAIRKTIEYYKLDIDYIEANSFIEEYENICDKYDKELMLKLFNEKFNLNLKMDFLDKWLYELGFMADYDEKLVSLLEYLSSKYELVVLTNWFKESQLERLKTIKVDKYFKEIYSGEECIKPNPKSFIKAIGDKKIEECIMIGDNYKIDIEGAINLGMKAILIDLNDKYENSDKYQRIKTIYELKEML